MAFYRKKPVAVEAVQWTGENLQEILDFAKGAIVRRISNGIIIKTLEGGMTGSPGDWIIKGVKGEFYPCKPDIFAATYEQVDGANG